MGLPSFTFHTEWVSVHLYPEGIFILKCQEVIACHEYTNLTTIPFVVFDYGGLILNTT